jgi:carbamoyltransferase
MGNYEIWIQELGFERSRGEPIMQTHKNFAFHLQLTLEEIVKDLINFYVNSTGIGQIAIAGGVAMNCKLNREITNMQVVEDLFIQPVANDTGISLGCALEAYRQCVGTAPEVNLNNVYFGPKYSDRDIETVLKNNKLEFTKYSENEVCSEVAKLLANQKLVGWFQGQMEFGARALGNRSILADPRSHEMRDNVNNNVKKRESWRPFAPSILYDQSGEFLKYGDEASYMIILDEVKKSKQKEVAAITHVDGTTRPQTVRKEQNKKYYYLINEFYKITGIPLILNTSFNVAGEPIVESPNQAIADFYRTGLDALAIGNYLLKK